jgi:hypothetical protein
MTIFKYTDQNGNEFEEEYDEEEDEREIKLIEEMFPDAKFTICIDSKELDDVISNKDTIVIMEKHTCYCYDDNPRNNDYIIVKNKGNGITNKDMINAMIENNYDPKCNHRFLEMFSKVNDVTYEVWFGS